MSLIHDGTNWVRSSANVAANAQQLPSVNFNNISDVPAGFAGLALVKSSVTPKDFDVFSLSPSEPNKVLSNLPSPYYPATSKEHVYLSVAYSKDKFGNYPFWAAGSPYPNDGVNLANIYENPCIYASLNGLDWVVPAGVTNPIFNRPAAGNYADATMIFAPDASALYVIWIWEGAGSSIPGGYAYAIMGSSSTDGITWSAPVVIQGVTTANAADRPDSPSMFWNPITELWNVYYHYGTGTGIRYITNTAANPMTGIGWAAANAVTIANPYSRGWWHSWFGCTNTGKVLVMLQDGGSGGGNLYVGSGINGANFTVQPFTTSTSSASGRYYKPALCITNDATPRYILYVSRLGGYYSNEFPSVSWNVDKIDLDLNERAKRSESAINRDLINRLIKPSRDYVVYESFNRADQATGLTVADSGQTWSSNVLGISSNQAYNYNLANARSWIDSGVTDFYVEMELGIAPIAGSNGFIMFNVVDVNNYWRFGWAVNNQLKLTNVVAGAVGINLLTVISGLTAGDRIGVERNGNYISTYYNDLLIDSTYQPQFASNSFVGIQTSTQQVNINSFTVKRGKR
jgi:hypothetical protein